MADIISFNGGKSANDEPKIPSNDYILTNHSDEDFFGSGFLIFTAHHVAVMRDDGEGAVPVLVMPLTELKVAELADDDDEDSGTLI